MATEQRNKVLQLMADQGYISQEHADKLMASKLKVYKHPPNLNKSLADYFVDYVTRQLTKRYGSAMVFEGGLKVITSIDLDVAAGGHRHHQVDHRAAGLRLQALARRSSPSTRPTATSAPWSAAWTTRSRSSTSPGRPSGKPGSSMKPFVLTTAVEQGMDPDSTYYSSKSPIIIPMGAFAAPWVVNGDGPGGPESVSAATTISDNVVFAQLSVDVGPENTVDVAHRMGITSPLDAVPSITLGTSGVTPLEMADAYATLAANGIHHKPQAIVKVYRTNGALDWKPKTTGKRAIPAGVASVVTQCLERVTASAGTGLGGRRATSRTRAPARPAPPRTAGTSGTPATRPTSPPPSGWATRRRTRPWTAPTAAIYCAPMWAKFFAAALKDSEHPSFKDFPWTFSPWEGKMQTSASPSASASASPSKSASPSPGPTNTIKPKPTPTNDQAAQAHADADQDQAAQAHADADGHAQRAAEAGGRVQLVADRPWDLAAADVSAAGIGSGGTGAAGAVVDWLAGLFGL